MEIQKNLFDLSSKEEETSKSIYDGTIIKCLVAPYHTYAQLEKIVPFTKTTYLFPEREMPIHKLRSLVSIIVASKKTEEVRIITTNQNVIMDMVDGCVRVLTEDGKIVPSPVKTFMANIHDIRYSLLENKVHQTSEIKQNEGVDKINKIISQVQSKKAISRKEYDKLLAEIKLIGEPLISDRLQDMIKQLPIK